MVNFNGTRFNENKKRNDRPQTARTAENIEAVRNSFFKFCEETCKIDPR